MNQIPKSFLKRIVEKLRAVDNRLEQSPWSFLTSGFFFLSLLSLLLWINYDLIDPKTWLVVVTAEYLRSYVADLLILSCMTVWCLMMAVKRFGERKAEKGSVKKNNETL